VKLTDLCAGAGRPVLLYPKVAEFAGGIPEGLFLAQLIYWQGKQKSKDGWIYKTQDDWEEETGLGRRSQQGARATLVQKGFIDEKYEGIPRQLYYKLKAEKVETAWKEWSAQYAPSEHTDAPNVHAIKGTIDDSIDDSEKTDAHASAAAAAKFEPYPGRLPTESIYDWFMRMWKTGTYREKSVAIGATFITQFAREPNYARLMKMAKDLGSGLRLFQFILQAAGQPVSDDPHDYLAGMVSRELKNKKLQPEKPKTTPVEYDSSFM